MKIVYCIGEAYRKLLLGIYHEKYLEAGSPQVSSFQKLKDRFEFTGNVAYVKKEVTVGQINKEDE